MGQVIQCNGCEQLPATLLVTNIDNGDVLGFCLPCSGVWAQGYAAVMVEAFPELFDQPSGGEPAEQGPADTAASPAEQELAIELGDGGDDSGAVRESDRGPEGVSARGAGAAGPDDTGADRDGGSGRSGSGRSGSGQARRAGRSGVKPAATG